MSLLVCIVPVAPLRKEAAHRSEMVSQLLFGEVAEVLEETALFVRLRCLYEGYEGWCQRTQLTKIDASQFDLSDKTLAPERIVATLNGQPLHLSTGNPLYIFSQPETTIGPFKIQYIGARHDPSNTVFSAEKIKAVSMQFINTPYLWGGRSVFGIDCSGFAQQVFRFFDKLLPRDAYQQAEEGEVVGFLQEGVCGDLAFFDNDEGRITHVGIMLDTQTIIHASGRVRVDPIDSLGIVSADTGERTHRLRVIKRYGN